jgi:hydrophobic/amphiphilic exporter-1 (mainly G- bacteria), HAE1 family
MRTSSTAKRLEQDLDNAVQTSLAAQAMLVTLYSPKESYDGIFLANYATININDQLTRVPGVSKVQVFGAGQYAMQ